MDYREPDRTVACLSMSAVVRRIIIIIMNNNNDNNNIQTLECYALTCLVISTLCSTFFTNPLLSLAKEPEKKQLL